MRQLLATICFTLIGILLIAGCTHNPFAPKLGDGQTGLWSDQSSVGGLLTNFVNSYVYRDSTRYSDCLSESFIFVYYDPDNGRFEQWYRITDLQTTGALLRSYEDIRLTLGSLPQELLNFKGADTVVSFQVSFNLELGGQLPVYGIARFETRKESDGKFRFTSWHDDF